MTEELPITSSEWEVMRIIWTMGQATSNEVVHLLLNKMAWKASTVKTLISRLMQKKNVNSPKRRAHKYLSVCDSRTSGDAKRSDPTISKYVCNEEWRGFNTACKRSSIKQNRYRKTAVGIS